MRQILSEIVIAAKPQMVWKVLMDFQHYSDWNPLIKSIEGEKALNGKLHIKIQPPGAKEMMFKPEIKVFEPNKELTWLGSVLMKGLFDGQHSFILEERDDGHTKFVHNEKFTGLLVGLGGSIFDKSALGFQQMNEALKKKCESKM